MRRLSLRLSHDTQLGIKIAPVALESARTCLGKRLPSPYYYHYQNKVQQCFTSNNILSLGDLIITRIIYSLFNKSHAEGFCYISQKLCHGNNSEDFPGPKLRKGENCIYCRLLDPNRGSVSSVRRACSFRARGRGFDSGAGPTLRVLKQLRNEGNPFALQEARPSRGSDDHVAWRSCLQQQT